MLRHPRRPLQHDSDSGVNGLEGFWAQLKRGIAGTHIHVSPKHLPKYLGEFEFRHNRRDRPGTVETKAVKIKGFTKKDGGAMDTPVSRYANLLAHMEATVPCRGLVARW